jgi:hypothetical protein
MESKTTKKNHILKTAMYLFSIHGKEKTSMYAIAKQANVSKALLFNYFENKDTLYQEVIAWTQSIMNSIRNSSASNTSHFFDKFLEISNQKLLLETNYPGILNFSLFDASIDINPPEYPFTEKDILSLKGTVNPKDIFKHIYLISLAHVTLVQKGHSYESVFESFKKEMTFIKKISLKEEYL